MYLALCVLQYDPQSLQAATRVLSGSPARATRRMPAECRRWHSACTSPMACRRFWSASLLLESPGPRSGDLRSWVDQTPCLDNPMFLWSKLQYYECNLARLLHQELIYLLVHGTGLWMTGTQTGRKQQAFSQLQRPAPAKTPRKLRPLTICADIQVL